MEELSARRRSSDNAQLHTVLEPCISTQPCSDSCQWKFFNDQQRCQRSERKAAHVVWRLCSSWDKTQRGSNGLRISEFIVAVVHTNANALLELDAERRETGSREDAEIVVGAVDDEAQQLLDL